MMQDRELGRDEVRDRVEDRAELGLRGEEREDQDLGDDEGRVDGGGGGGGPAEARGLRRAVAKMTGSGDAHGDVGDGAVEHDVPGVLHEEEHLAADGEAAEVEEEALQG